MNRYKHDKSLSREEEQQILQGLSAHLLDKIIFQTKQKILNKDEKIFSIFSQEFRDKLCLKLKETYVHKDEIIFEQDTKQDDPQMYFIHKGCIEIYYKNKYNQDGTILKCLRNGQQFGENSFLQNIARSASARAKESAILYSISKSDLLDQLSCFTYEKEKYCYMLSKMMFRQANSAIAQQCYNCSNEKHCNNYSNFYHSIIIHFHYLHLQYFGNKSIFLIYKQFRNALDCTIPQKKIQQYQKPITQNLICQENILGERKEKNLAIQFQLQRINILQKNQQEYKVNFKMKYFIEINILLKQFLEEEEQNISKEDDKLCKDDIVSEISSEEPATENEFLLEKNALQFQQAIHIQPSHSFSELRNVKFPYNVKKTGQEEELSKNQTMSKVKQQSEQLFSQKCLLQKVEQESKSNIEGLSQPLIMKSCVQTKSTPDQQTAAPILNKYNRADQYKILEKVQKKQGEHSSQTTTTYEKVKQQFKIPKMSFNEDAADSNDLSIIDLDEQSKSPINWPGQYPTSIKPSFHKRYRQPSSISQRNNQKYYSNSDTIRNFVKFQEQYQQQSKMNMGQSQAEARKVQRKSLLKSNTTKHEQEEQLRQSQLSKANQNQEKHIIQENNIEDQMKLYYYFYPQYNYHKVLMHYDMLKQFQTRKLPPYFNVYSIYNRKNAKLRLKAEALYKEKQDKLLFK